MAAKLDEAYNKRAKASSTRNAYLQAGVALLTKTITYVNPFTEAEVSEVHYFHLSKADLVEMNMESLNEPEVTEPNTGEKLQGYRARLQRIVNSQDGVAVMEVVRDMMRRTYVRRDGDRPVKSKEIWETFESTEAFSQMFFELCTNAEIQADFMNNIMPKGMEKEVEALVAAQAAAQAANNASTTATTKSAVQSSEERDPTELTGYTTPRVLTPTEVNEMDSDELKSGLATGRYKLS